MWRLISFALAAAAVALAQPPGPEGVWNSDERYKGEPRVVIALTVVEGKLGGTIIMKGVIDDDNNSTTLNLVIDSAKVDGANLNFQTKMPDDNVAEWEMTVAGSTATASIVGDRDGPSSEPQRWKLKRAGPASAASEAPRP